MIYRTKDEKLVKAIYYMVVCSANTNDLDAIDQVNDLMMERWGWAVGEMGLDDKQSDIQLFQRAANWTIRQMETRTKPW